MDEARYNEMVAHVRKVRHDASNPLTAALGSVQLLLTDPAVTDAEVRDALQDVERELRRLMEILRGLNEVRPLEDGTSGGSGPR
ncbi:MAG: histidine kinase dimerization/phospho-acceptor domain-containing protein [Longimicrobiales bacterium]